nr:DExH-box ATP-dependent RNA helicase DExH5, mitochondrial [Tanacetum cinerariifolium]
MVLMIKLFYNHQPGSVINLTYKIGDGIYKYHTNPGIVSAIFIQPFLKNKVFDLSEKAPDKVLHQELLHSNDKQELVSREKKDRRVEQIANLSFVCQVVVSQVPLPYCRYDLDDKRLQWEVTLSPGLQRAVDAHLENTSLRRLEARMVLEIVCHQLQLLMVVV